MRLFLTALLLICFAVPSQAAQQVTIDGLQAYRLVYEREMIAVPLADEKLLSRIVSTLAAHRDLAVQLRAYAYGTPDTAPVARRLSLQRAMALRAWLVNKGVSARRLDVRALGIGDAELDDKASRAVPDRIDLIILRR